jgi:hypothetical protein
MVSSCGRPIGGTDLGFVRIGARLRSGWFHPNAEGKRLMLTIGAVLPALRAYAHADAEGDDGQSIVELHMPGSTRLADLAEALQHVAALDLALHREDGSLVTTESIGIQDTEQLLALAAQDEPRCDAMARESDDVLMEDVTAQGPPWALDDESPALQRYQIHVWLAEDAAVP